MLAFSCKFKLHTKCTVFSSLTWGPKGPLSPGAPKGPFSQKHIYYTHLYSNISLKQYILDPL